MKVLYSRALHCNCPYNLGPDINNINTAHGGKHLHHSVVPLKLTVLLELVSLRLSESPPYKILRNSEISLKLC